MLTAETVLAYASPDTLAGLIADCRRYQEWDDEDDDTADAEAIERLAMAELSGDVGDEEAVAMVARKIALG